MNTAGIILMLLLFIMPTIVVATIHKYRNKQFNRLAELAEKVYEKNPDIAFEELLRMITTQKTKRTAAQKSPILLGLSIFFLLAGVFAMLAAALFHAPGVTLDSNSFGLSCFCIAAGTALMVAYSKVKALIRKGNLE